ncbi:hypothetical protein [Leptodesmis sichuanensis]|uniref:hypothetical protein n=1 Tax=Leptodesmis sichuanensis TaxID=2906798 RepID=UPI001F1866D6|nr:hypothetical protein [Leptodesmis sichuanensis]UIE37160.1 hypothetical protein KIK02_19660 [Leptodesmis sichuanensis A121]
MQHFSQPKLTNAPESPFQPYQLVCLEHGGTYLYAEVVQMADGKQVCWVRPLVLVRGTLEWSQDSTLVPASSLYDLRHCSDLLLPSALFRSAFDTEVIPLLSHLAEVESSNLVNITLNTPESPQAQLHQLLKQVCLGHPELF